MIPEMTDPLGQYWDQPHDIRSAPLDSALALLTHRQMAELSDYSHSMPSGVYPGKCWKRWQNDDRRRMSRGPGKWLLCWYGVHKTDPKLCTVEFREIRIGRLKQVQP